MKKNIKIVFIVCLVLGILLGALNLFAASQRGHLAEIEAQQAARKKALGQIEAADILGIDPSTVEVPDEGGLIVNGNHMIESNIYSQTTPYVGFVEYPLTLGEDECFVMADHRNGGADSRFFGPVKKSEILGTVITIVRRNNL